MRSARLCAIAALIALLTLTLASPALAAGGHAAPPSADILGIGHLFGDALGSIGSAILGGLKWTVGIAAKFLLATLGGLVKLLIPKSWAKDAIGVMHWIVAVPNYAGQITSPGGGHVYGFSGINALRDLFTWIAAALLPLTLTFGTTRAMFGSGGHPVAPIARVVALAAVLISYPWWWSQAAAVINQITNFIFALHPVTDGTYRLMEIAVGGGIVAGWAFGGVLVMGAVGLTLLALIFMKVVIILAGALLYATGPIVLALAPTESGIQVARAWVSAALAILALPLLWACTFAVGALLINDSNRAGVLVGGSGGIAHLLGGLLVGLAGLASLWMCIKIAREVGSVLRTQLGGLLALASTRGSSSSTSSSPAMASATNSLRSFGSRVGQAGSAALGELSASGRAGATAARVAGGAATFARGGLIGVAASGARAAGSAAAPGAAAGAALIGRSRAGAVAVHMGRSARGSWQQTASSQRQNASAKPAAPGEARRPTTTTPRAGGGTASTPSGGNGSAAAAGATGATGTAAGAAGDTPKPGGPQPAATATGTSSRRQQPGSRPGSTPRSTGAAAAPGGASPASGQTSRAPSASPPPRSSTRSSRPASPRPKADRPAPNQQPAPPPTSSPRPPAKPPRQPPRNPNPPKR
jgi:hypothetical protein